ncbi:cytochrome P450 [Auricularia subglabra TFB-10046 SS5]|uniref:Cytochrome P450 n=1 Tax=Auricularia subglabra (strain TFB-10046 / SS5) TaxID=717982 RepID=J0D0C2_AURST|nr:cytochrome P450 [Auricularia subglabra TFB-10046 SS5]
MTELLSSIAPAAGILCAVWFVASLLKRRSPRLPPGPPRKFLIGNLYDIPTHYEWLEYEKISKQYGDIISLEALGQRIIVMSNDEDVKELFTTRGSIYAGRARGTMAQMVGDGVVMMQPGKEFRTIRRLMSTFMGPQAVKHITEVQETAIREVLLRLMREPQDPLRPLQRMFGAIVLRLSFGYEVKEDNDYFIQLAETSISAFLHAFQPGWAVDTWPILRYLPSWLPFAKFKRDAAEWSEIIETGLRIPWEWTKSRIAAGDAIPSWASDLMGGEDEWIGAMAMRDLYSAGVDSTMTASLTFLLAMALHPDIQTRAQRDVDLVTGGERLPTIADRDQLPYLDAIIKELLRWHSIVNLALPHVATEDDTLRGYDIPKGTIVMANVWTILHDPKKYPDPMSFKPERFMPGAEGENEDPSKYAFGFGPRICPGRHLADATLFLVLAITLATCNVSDAVDEYGVPLKADSLEYLSGEVSRPPRFRCKIEPRSEHSRTLLSESD